MLRTHRIINQRCIRCQDYTKIYIDKTKIQIKSKTCIYTADERNKNS